MRLKEKLEELRAFKAEIFEIGETIHVSFHDTKRATEQVRHIENVKIRLLEINKKLLSDKEEVRRNIPWNKIHSGKTQTVSEAVADSVFSGLFGGVSATEAKEIVDKYDFLPNAISGYLNRADRKLKLAYEYLQNPEEFHKRMNRLSLIQLGVIAACVGAFVLAIMLASHLKENRRDYSFHFIHESGSQINSINS